MLLQNNMQYQKQYQLCKEYSVKNIQEIDELFQNELKRHIGGNSIILNSNNAYNDSNGEKYEQHSGYDGNLNNFPDEFIPASTDNNAIINLNYSSKNKKKNKDNNNDNNNNSNRRHDNNNSSNNAKGENISIAGSLSSEMSLSASEKEQLFIQLETCVITLFHKVSGSVSQILSSSQPVCLCMALLFLLLIVQLI